jgi:hypothetical protein
MRRIMLVFITLMMMPLVPVSANETPFNFYIDEEVVIHPGETVPFRIAWHNIVGFERHFEISVNQSHSNLTISEIPENWTSVASGRLNELNINLSVDQNSNFETIQFSLDIRCQEVPEWEERFEVNVVVSRWSNLNFGANDSSSIYVQQGVNTSLAMNISNNAGYDDLVKIRMDTASNWQHGFVDDVSEDGELHLDLSDGADIYINFWVYTPSVQNGAPLAGTGPTFSLEAESSLDGRVISWSFVLEMQTFHNMSIDHVDENLSLSPGDTGRIEVTVRNNGNVDTKLDASLLVGSITGERVELNGWTIALFNAFEDNVLAPNESRVLDIGFESPNVNINQIEVELIVKPQAFPQRINTISVSSTIDWNRGGTLSLSGYPCISVEVNNTCQRQINIENTGNYYDEYSLILVNETGMEFDITQDIIGLSRDQTSVDIPLNMTPFVGAEGYTPASAKLELHRIDGLLLDSISIESSTEPYVNWIWEDTESSISNGKLEVAITMRNEGNIVDGLVIRMSSSYYTEMSIIPPTGAIIEDGSTNIRSFEIINCEVGGDFTFRAWAKIPDTQGSDGEFFLNFTAHSRFSGENPFTYSTNSSFDGVVEPDDEDNSVVDSFGNALSTTWNLIWAWKWIVMAVAGSGLLVNKSLKDRRARLENSALLAPLVKEDETPDDWLAEFSNKKQPVPAPVESMQVPGEVFTGMFRAVGGHSKPTAEPVDSVLVGAASTILDHHDTITVKARLDSLATEIASGDISKPHNANIALPDDIIPETSRTVSKPRIDPKVPEMLNLDDLDL